jgi:hypothetical protein
VRASPVFSPEALRQAYQMLTQDTMLSGSRLFVEELATAASARCAGRRWELSPDDVARSAKCSSRCAAGVAVVP